MYHGCVLEVRSTQIARQPFTFGGVARFSSAGIGRLLFIALLFGLVSGVVVSWLISTRVAPVVDEAVSKLPPTGSVEQGLLRWPEKTSRLLAANTFLSLEVALDDLSSESAPVDFAVQLRTNQLAATSIFGTATLIYPPRLELELNRTTLAPAWGAWRAPILFGLIPATALVLMLTWATLAVAYLVVPLLIGAALNRRMGIYGAWKLSVAAQLAGSLIMVFALALYSTGQIALIFVFAMFVAHFIPTAIYLLLSPFFAPKAEIDPVEANPFESAPRSKSKGKNPFAGK